MESDWSQLDERTKNIQEDVRELQRTVITKDVFEARVKQLEAIVHGMVSAALLAILAAVLSRVIAK